MDIVCDLGRYYLYLGGEVVVKTLPANTGDADLVPGSGGEIPWMRK